MNTRSFMKSRKVMRLLSIIVICFFLPNGMAFGALQPPLGRVTNPVFGTTGGIVPADVPPHLAPYVKNVTAAIKLGKALFWDMQAGSDGVTACATCHYRAGADPIDVRSKNQLAPRPFANSTSLFNARGANSTLTAADFPFFLVNPVDAQIGTGTVTKNISDVVGSQGVRLAKFEGVILGSPVDSSSPLVDTVFPNLRQVTGRNTPPAVNAVFNYANFWDGRANN